MGDKTEISWTDHTFNPWMGCTKVSPACANCYAERDMANWLGKVKWGPNGTRVKTSPANWQKPIKWNQDAKAAGVRRRVFCASLADVFEDWQGPIMSGGKEPVILSHNGRASSGDNRMTMDDLRAELFAMILRTPWLDWLLLTKRPENVVRMWPVRGPAYVPNVWLGTSVENQEFADQRIPRLLKCRDLSPVLFLSCEPLLGMVDFRGWLGGRSGSGIDWVISGGESGPKARPSDPNWFRSLRDQCQTARIAYHHKQNGELALAESVSRSARKALSQALKPGERIEDLQVYRRVGLKAAGRLLDGVEHNEFPSPARAQPACGAD